MLDTVLELGRVLRSSPEGLKHHRYVKKAPIPDEKRNPVIFWQIPVEPDGSFDFSKRHLLMNENEQWFYLNYKKSDADSTKPYLFGDIYRTVTKIGEDGNFRFGDPSKGSWMRLNSFERAGDIEAIPSERVKKFRASFQSQLPQIEQFLRENLNVYIHFDFDGKGWHELEELELLNENLLNTFFEPIGKGYVLKAFLFKTLGAGTSAIPGFTPGSEFKTRVFKTKEEAMDLLYGINYSSRSVVRKNDLKLIVLPRGEHLTVRMIEDFFERNTLQEASEEAQEGEAVILHEAQSSLAPQPSRPAEDEEEFTAFFAEDERPEKVIPQFDFIFSKAGGTKPDIDMIELAGLERSKLRHISDRIAEKREDVYKLREEFLIRLMGNVPAKLPPLRINLAFLNLLGDPTRAKKKYQSHLFRVLPQIYTETYFQDPVLLPALIEKAEFNLRNDVKPDFNFLKFDYIFLTKLQNYEGDRYMETQNSASYQIGVLLGHLARPLRYKINSFDKNYAGLLSRRITSVDDVIKLSNEFNQKLIMHQRAGVAAKYSPQLTQALVQFSGPYNKDHCALGFFESYYAPKSQEEKKDEENEDKAPEQ